MPAPKRSLNYKYKFDISNVTTDGEIYSRNGDSVELSLNGVKATFKYKPTMLPNATFWDNATGRYDAALGIITGTGQVALPNGDIDRRTFSIALDRGATIPPAYKEQIHVYVSDSSLGTGGAPEDGTWIGGGK